MEIVGDYKYNTKELIGHGAFAVVYKGYHIKVSDLFFLYVLKINLNKVLITEPIISRGHQEYHQEKLGKIAKFARKRNKNITGKPLFCFVRLLWGKRDIIGWMIVCFAWLLKNDNVFYIWLF